MVRAADFYSDHPPQRILGSEYEYTIQPALITAATRIVNEQVVARGLADLAKEYDIPEYHYIVYSGRIILQNAAMLYRDAGEHVEYSTQECRGPHEAAAADSAGLKVIQSIVAPLMVAGSWREGMYRRTGSYIRNNLSTCGYHENALIPSQISTSLAMSPLLPSYLSTRWWSYAGMMTPDGYQLSQKVSDIGGDPINIVQNNRRTKALQKPMATIMLGNQDQEINPNPDFTRVEIRYADGGQSRWSRFASHAMNTLVLRLHEHSDKLPPPTGWALREPVRAAHQISQDLSLRKTYDTVDGKKVSAANVQEILATQGLLLSEIVELPLKETEGAQEILNINYDLGQARPEYFDFGKLIDAVDWAAKLHYMRNVRGINPQDYAKAAAIDLYWDRISPSQLGLNWFSGIGGRQNIIDPRTIDSLVCYPPRHTRAAIRGQSIRTSEATEASWSFVKTKKGVLDTPNPYIYELR